MKIYTRIVAITCCCIFAVLLAAGVAGAEDLKIGYVDARRAMNECREGRQVKSAMTAEIERLQNQITARQNELQNLREAIDRQATVLTDEARSARERDLQHKNREYARWADEIQVELKQKRDELEAGLSRKIQKVIEKIGAEEGYTVILEKNEKVVLYVTKGIDLTDKVIKGLDALAK